MKRILAGPRAVAEAIHASPGAIELICVAESLNPTAVRHIEDLARHAMVTVEILPRSSLDQLAKQLNHQGVIAITGSYPYADMDSFLAAQEAEPNPLVAVLDQLQDPGNLGAIMRSAYAFRATGIIIPKDRSAPVTAATVRASCGASELVRTVRVTNLVRAMDSLRERGFELYGAALDGDISVRRLSWRGKRALVLGNESRGLRRLTREHCDRLFQIPMPGEFDSLNVAAAAAVALYEAANQRFPERDDAAR